MDASLDTEYSLELRKDMVEEQLIARGINNSLILQSFLNVPRHLFIPAASLYDAYSDQPLPIKSGQTISQPFIVAQMLTYLDIQPHHNILEIGSGSGYATALLSYLCDHVDAYEVYGNLIEDSRRALSKLDIKNVTLHHRSVWEQIEGSQVYDRIILWASPPIIPEHLFKSLSSTGTLVAPVGKVDQYVWHYKNAAGNLTKTRKDPVRFVPLVQGSTKEIDN